MAIQNSKRFTFNLVLIFLFAASQFVFGSGQKEPAQKADEGKQETVNIRVSWWGGESRHQKWHKMLDAFEKKYPKIKVGREFTDYNAYWDKLATQAAGGNAPDVIMQVMHKFSEYVVRGQLMLLDPLIAAKKIDLSDWSQGIIDSGKWDGKVYMVTYGNTSNGIMYNETLLQQVGVKAVPTAWKWDEFVSKAKELQRGLPASTWAIEDLGGYDYLFANWCLSKGKEGEYTKEGKLAFGKPELIEWFTMWDGLRKAGATPPPSVQAEYPSERPEQTMLARGKVTMFVRPFNQLPAFQSATKNQLKLAPVPSDARSGQDLGGSYISLYAKTRYPEQALQLLNYFIADTAAADVMGVEYGPMGSAKMNDYLLTTVTPAQQVGVAFMKSIADRINVPTIPPAGANEITNHFNLANEAIAFGQKSIEKAVDDFLAEAKRILR